MQRFEYFSNQDVQKIHEATLRILETVGVDVHHDEARQMLADAGCPPHRAAGFQET